MFAERETTSQDEGGSVPTSLQIPQASDSFVEETSPYLSPSKDVGNDYDSDDFEDSHVRSSNRRQNDQRTSLDASGASNQGSNQPIRRADLNLFPGGAPLLEQAFSQKEFIIKTQKYKSKSKSKRGGSKGKSLLKAYFPNLIAKKDVTLITPKNGPTYLNSSSGMAYSHGQSSGSAQQLAKKFVQVIQRAQHDNISNQQAQQLRLLKEQDSNGGFYVPNDGFQNQAQQIMVQSDGQRGLVVIDDNRRTAPRLSSDASGVPLRKQISQVRENLQPILGQDERHLPKRGRRNSFAGPEDQQNPRNMLPPIFSGPNKKNSQKAAKLIPVAKGAAYRSHISETSPLQYNKNSETIVIPNTERQGSAMINAENSAPQSIRKETVPYNSDLNQTQDEKFNEGEQRQFENQNKPKMDFVTKNALRLQEMQEQRNKELKEIQEQRAKLLRRQEKLKMNVLRDAQAYRQRKAEQSKVEQIQPDDIKLANVKNEARGHLSPARVEPKLTGGLATPTAVKQNDASRIEDDKTSEEKREEKKKVDMMRKFYRNRHSSFLQALVEQKAKKEKEEQTTKERAEKKKLELKKKVLGDDTRIKPKVFELKTTDCLENNDVMVPAQLAGITAFDSTAKSTTVTKSAKISKSKSMRRGISVSSLSAADIAYNDSSTLNSSKRKNTTASRGSTREHISNKTDSEQKTLPNRSAQNFNRGRTLTPKVHAAKVYQTRNQLPVMNSTEQLQFDEKREQEILKEAADRKQRAIAIRDRQEKQLAAIKEKVLKDKLIAQAELERKQKLQEEARKTVLQQAIDIKNLPSLRDQQDSRMKKKREEEGDKDKQIVLASPNPAKPPKPPIESEAFNKFLERNKNMLTTKHVQITDMKEWKKRNRVEPDQKVFIIRGGYNDVKQALKSRGWVQNKDKESPCFDFMWTLMTKDVPHNALLPNQIVNHFPTATSITTKVGLIHSLKNLIWFNAVDIDTFYPRCYDLAIGEEVDDFIQEFKQLKAVNYMKIWLREMREAYVASGNSTNPMEEIKSASVSDKIYKVAMKVCKMRTRDLDDLIDDPNGFECLVNEQDWAILSADEHSEETLQTKKHADWERKQAGLEKKRNKAAAAEIKQKLEEKKNKEKAKVAAKDAAKDKLKKGGKELKKKAADVGSGEVDEENEEDEYEDGEYDDEYGDYGDEQEGNPGEILVNQNDEKQKGALTLPKPGENQYKEADEVLSERYPKFAEALKVLNCLREKYPQFNLDGERNIWIMKPAGSSRGRGICLKRDLCEILDMIRFKESAPAVSSISNQKNGQLYICQKYIENTLIVKSRKFDIRQWVLVTDWNPLTIWIYAEPYIRFPAADFDFNKITNRYAHLSNNSIAKYGKNVKVTYSIPGNMWSLEEFQEYLITTYGFDVWEEKIVESIKNIVINSLESVQDNFESKKGLPFEMFGYDIMIDDDFNCWLIEVNSSPAMDYSTHVTERLVKMVLEDTIKVVIDYGNASAKKQKKIETGGFECVYKAKRLVEKPLNSFGLNMEVQGKKIPKAHLKKY